MSKEIKTKTKAELIKMDKDSRAELFQLRLKSKTGQLEQKHQIRQTRREIARVQTRLNELARQS